MGAGGGGEGGAHGMGKGGGFDSSGPAGLGADAFGGDDEKEMPWYSPLIGISLEQLDPSKHTTNPQLDAWGRPINTAYNWGPFDTRYAHDPKTGTITGQPTLPSGLSALKSVQDTVQDAVQDAADAVNSIGQGFSIPSGLSALDAVEGMARQSFQIPDQSVSYNTNAVSNVVSRSLKEAAARKKTVARARAKAVVKEAARLKAKEEHRAKVLKDRAKVVVAKPTTRPNPVLTIRPTTPKPVTPTTPRPAPLTDHQFNVRIREQTKARLARAREKTKAHYANLRKKGVSAKTIKLAQSKAKARYAKITAQGKAKYR